MIREFSDGNEQYYQQARNLVVIFIRYEDDHKPLVKYIKDGENKKIAVSVRDHVLDTEIEIAPDRVILASAMEPQKDAEILSQMLKIPLNEDRFFMKAHVKLRPVDFSAEGIFLAGLAHSPKNVQRQPNLALWHDV